MKKMDKVSKLTRKEKAAKAEELRIERIRRRKENPGNGSAYISALVFMDKIIDDALIEKTAKHVVELNNQIDELNNQLEIGQKTLATLIEQAWEAKTIMNNMVAKLRCPKKSSAYRTASAEHEALTAMVTKFHQSQAETMEKLNAAKEQVRSEKAWLNSLKVVGNGYQKAMVKLWTGKTRKEKDAAKEEKPMRHAAKVKEKEHVKSFSVYTFNPNTVNKPYIEIVTKIQKYKPYYGDDEKKIAENKKWLVEVRTAVKQFITMLKEDCEKPFELNLADGRVTRLPVTKMAKVFAINPDSPKPIKEWVVVNHGFEDFVNANWQVFADDEDEAEKARSRIVGFMYRRLAMRGIAIKSNKYRFLFSSPSMQKSEKAVFALGSLCDLHSDVLYMGKSVEDFSKDAVTAAAYLKATANLCRPEAATLDATVFDILPTKDVKRVYHHGHALKIGGKYNGKLYEYSKADNPVIVGDGQMIALVDFPLYGQLSGLGWKGLLHGSKSVIAEFCKKHNLTVEEFYNLEVEFFNGKKARLGDYKIICGEGCWKFDKMFSSYDKYLDWTKSLMAHYPDIEKLTILRQLDEEEDEYKIRRLTRSLIQQWIWADNEEIGKLTNKAVRKLNEYKTMHGALEAFAGLNKPEDERTDLERLFELCPWILSHKNMIRHMVDRFDIWKNEAMANKLRTQGQYPYIIQDPIALLEIWVLGMDPNRDDLGVLKAGEISLNEVPEDKKVLGVRFPANFLTAKTLTCKPYAQIFESCGNVAVLSIYDDILIRQDGDVDGDEMCIIYDELAIMLTERMIKTFNPPVVVFDHGAKGNVVAPGSVNEFYKQIGNALYSAHHNGQIGIFANLARDCCYQLSIAYMNGDDDKVNQYLLWMAAASTGAILAIDQVKGNQFSESLVDWLQTINKKVKKTMGYCQPFTQHFLKGISLDSCLGPNNKVITDRIAIRIEEKVEDLYIDDESTNFDSEGIKFNKERFWNTLGTSNQQWFKIRNNVLEDSIVETMRANYFNDKLMDDGTVMDAKLLERIKSHQEVGLKDVVLFWWHNEQALKNRLAGNLLSETEEDLYDHIRESILKFALSNKKPNGDGYVRTAADEKRSLYVWLLNEAFEFLSRGNGIKEEDKGSYAYFILKIVAPWALAMAKKNGVGSNGPIPTSLPEAETTDWNSFTCDTEPDYEEDWDDGSFSLQGDDYEHDYENDYEEAC